MKLVELPSDLLNVILGDLEWQDILHVRRTCKCLCETSKARPVWLSLFNRYRSIMPRTVRLERPIHLYTSEELEHVILRWKSAQISWRMKNERLAVQRVVPTAHSNAIHLLEGGRWLLSLTNVGSVFYYDLDAQDSTGVELIPPQIDKNLFNNLNRVLMSVDVDSESKSPYLTFNVALSIDKPPVTRGLQSPVPRLQSIQVWRITSVLDDQQRTLGLTSIILSSFLQTPPGNVHSLSLLGPFLAISINCEQDDLPYVFVIKWGQAKDHLSTHRRRIIYTSGALGPRCLCLLPGNKLLVVSPGAVKMYDCLLLQEMKSTILGGAQVDRTEALWEVKFDRLEGGTLSRPFFCSDTTRFVILASGGIHGLIIDNAEPTNPGRFVKLMNSKVPRVSRSQFPHFGYRQAASVSGRSLMLLSYSWPDDGDYDIRRPTAVPMQVLSRRHTIWPFVDEASGRVALAHSSRLEAVVVDVSLFTR